jgi:phosphoglycerate dehydrogenase-like enzyme
MATLNLLLNIAPYQLTGAQRQQISAAVPGADVFEIPEKGDVDLDHYDGSEIDALVSEFVPQDLSAWPRLRFVQLVSAGIDHLVNPSHPVWDTGIAVATASGIHGVPMAQYATGVLLMMVHKLPQASRLKETREWPDRLKLAGTVLRGFTAGLIGYGSIGRECARQLHALGLRILAMKRDPDRRRDHGFNAWPGTGDPEGLLPERWYAPDQLSEMLPQCDVLVVTAPRTPETTGLIGSTELAQLKPGAWIVVISRGGIVEEGALAAALRTGQIAGAAVDAYSQEPIRPENPLFVAPNLILTPHVSGVYESQWPQTVSLICENLGRFQTGQPLLNLADGRLGY